MSLPFESGDVVRLYLTTQDEPLLMRIASVDALGLWGQTREQRDGERFSRVPRFPNDSERKAGASFFPWHSVDEVVYLVCHRDYVKLGTNPDEPWIETIDRRAEAAR